MKISSKSLIKLGIQPTKQNVRIHTNKVIRSIKHVLVDLFKVRRSGLKDKIAIDLFIEKYKILLTASDSYEDKMYDCYVHCIKQRLIYIKPSNPKSPKKQPALKPLKQKSKPVVFNHPFYGSEEWRVLRLKVLRIYGCVCMKCGKKNSMMHVDHIKPRSKHPELELDFNNLQVLCKKCNEDKSNHHDTDYRPKDRLIPLKIS